MININLYKHFNYNMDDAAANEIFDAAVYGMTGKRLKPKKVENYGGLIRYILDVNENDKRIKPYVEWLRHGDVSGVFLRKFIHGKRYIPPCPFATDLNYYGAEKLRVKHAVEKATYSPTREYKIGRKTVTKMSRDTFYIYDIDARFVVLFHVIGLDCYLVFGLPWERLDEKYKAFILAPIRMFYRFPRVEAKAKYEILIDDVYDLKWIGGAIKTFYDWLKGDYASLLLWMFSRGD